MATLSFIQSKIKMLPDTLPVTQNSFQGQHALKSYGNNFLFILNAILLSDLKLF